MSAEGGPTLKDIADAYEARDYTGIGTTELAYAVVDALTHGNGKGQHSEAAEVEPAPNADGTGQVEPLPESEAAD